MARLWSAYGGFSDNFGPRCLTHSGVRVMFTAQDGLHKSITDAKLGQPNYFTQLVGSSFLDMISTLFVF